MESHTPLIIAGAYEVIGQIGSGGGGIVYLAEHLRLNKHVVLKADKREITTGTEQFRREVDALKDLSHTYIPQVYDFVVENGTVYTVMDFIEGESFDKPLRRGERFAQARVIEWACQLLEALAYLHGRPPHGILHADIKPANIMLTPQGDVRLIDFNIALALGEEGAVAVGRSFGYASPEHYSLADGTECMALESRAEAATDLSGVSDVDTVLETVPQETVSASSKKTIVLDVRSDIYSLGATLYHLLSGRRPARNAAEVEPLSPREHSPTVIAILKKAMDPDPGLRYQSAGEMLHAFEHLREEDPRSKRHRHRAAASVASITLLFLLGGAVGFVGLKQMERLQNAYVLAEYAQNALRAGDPDLALSYALQALPEERSLLTPPDTAEAQKALTDALGLYDLSDGFKQHKAVALPSAPLSVRLSPGGSAAAAVYAYAVAIIDTETGQVLQTLPAEPSALSEVEFLSETVLLYAGESGLCAYDIEQNAPLWVGGPCTGLCLSADGTRAAAVYKDAETAAVYNTASGQVLFEVDFGGRRQRVTANDSFANPNDDLLALNRDGSLLGVSFSDGSLWIYDLDDRQGDLELLDNSSGFTRFQGGFYGLYFAFSATGAAESTFAVIDTAALEQTGGFSSSFPFGVQADESGIYVQTENILVRLDPVTGGQSPLATVFDEIIQFAHNGAYTLVTTGGEYLFFDARARLMARHEKEHGSEFIRIAGDTAVIGSLDTPVLRFMRLETHTEAEIFSYDPAYAHDEARLSADGGTVMLFSFDEFLLYDRNGAILANVLLPDAGQVYDQQYRRDDNGSRLEVIYNDGVVRAYSALDGSLLSETAGPTPDLSLNEVFLTDSLRIKAPLHGTPAAYDRDTGKLVRELEKDAYLTYVTQVGENIVTEYISADGRRYGLLLNSRCETLAELPYLCDIVEGRLIFDYPSGNLRESRVYSIEELMAQTKDEGGN